MDMVTRLNIGFVFAALVLPAWAVWRLPRYSLSVPTGTLMFWTWSFVGGDLVREMGPEYDGFGPVFAFLFAWIIGAGYCMFWVAVHKALSPYTRRLRPRLLSAHAARFHQRVGLGMWVVVAALCLALPFSYRIGSREGDWHYLLGYAFTGGSILLLAAAMSATYLWGLIGHRPCHVTQMEADSHG